MKTILPLLIAMLCLSLNSRAQKTPDQNSTPVIHQVNISSQKKFVNDAKALIGLMGKKRIVALGEGTHGTAEFYKLRYWITRELIEKHGFTHIALENDLSDGLLLNQELNGKADLNSIMKKRLLSIWQNEETKELLTWVRNYNQTHKKRVSIDGIDYVYLNSDIEALRKVLTGEAAFSAGIEQLQAPASLQDEVWEAMNKKDVKVDFPAMYKSSYKGYLVADSLDQRINASNLSAEIKSASHLIMMNIKQGFSPFYHYITKTNEPSRDVNMAGNVAEILKNSNDKMVIWAHNAHVAKTGVFNNTVGGMGGEIAKLFPGQYFVMGTGTATGTFAATEQSRDSYTNPMKAYPLEKTVADSWETQFLTNSKPAFYFFPTQYNSKNEVKPIRFIGYGPKSDPSTNEKTNISQHFDAFLFVSNSNAASPLK
ncbi:erythromycin esterase family protein [Pedobacter nutrimenti]|jgi:erythromycin esterase-like protein|uniref:Erythromycin esterase-like protein n=1 Tax=Pedobacter nutrimenti TaxID=1241337 RepID=A0A318UEI7_9SPHI|nr:erythromycin esterase family protein [Pedobacter nutrimenti]PYF74806.1 erythromycin esterase-like protein [Pedobacter nutrimenti]